jgi:hypothetical protein
MRFPVSINFKALNLFLTFACCLCVSVARLHAEEESPVTVVEDNFESYRNTAAFKKFWPEGTGVLITNAPGGGKAVKHGGARFNRHGDFKITPDESHNVVLSADFYDFATNIDRRVTLSLTNDAGDLLAIGLVGASPYVVKAVGYTAATNWIAFVRRQIPVSGWHHFQATLSMSNVTAFIDLHADGTVDKRLTIPLTKPPPIFTDVCIGGHTSGAGWHSPVLVDNVKVQMVPVGWKLPLYNPRPPLTPEPTIVASAAPLTNLTAASVTSNSPVTVSPLAAAAPTSATEARPERPNPVTLAQTPPATSTSNSALWAICAALILIVGLLGYVLFVLRRATIPISASPTTPGTAIALSRGGVSRASTDVNEDDEQWKSRAMTAEALAAKQAQILHEKVGPELVEFAKDTLVQGLYKQRTALAQTQAAAQQALIDLEKRLADLDLPARDRLHAYEKRIAELEKDLETRNDEMRELTRATLLLMRKKMQEEREGSGPKLN